MGNLKHTTLKKKYRILFKKIIEELHLAKRKDESIACKKCHHGAKLVPKKVDLGRLGYEATDYVYRKEFKGVGLNKVKEITKK